MKRRNSFATVWAVLLAAAAGCGGGMSQGTIQGKVTSDQAFTGVSGSTVTAWQVDSQGGLTPLSGQATSDLSGNYSLVVTFPGASVQDLVVKASGAAGFQGEAIVSGSLASGGTVIAPPMTGQTRVQTDLFIQANLSGDWDPSTCTTSELRSQVDASIAASLQASSSYSSDLALYARALARGMRAKVKMLQSTAVGVTGAQVSAWMDAQLKATSQLDGSLLAAASQTDVSGALSVYGQAMVQAWTGAGITAEEMSEAVQADVNAQESAVGQLTSSVLAQAVVSVESAKAQAIGDADLAAVVALGASASLQSDVSSAQTSLESSIQASAGATGSISGAWSAYHSRVESDLNAAVGAAVSGGTSSMSTVESNLSGAQATLVSSLSASGGDPDLVVSAYSAFSLAVAAQVSASSTLSQMSSAELTATEQGLATVDFNG